MGIGVYERAPSPLQGRGSLLVPLLCKDGNFFRRGKSWEVELEPEGAKRVCSSGFVPIMSMTLPHLASPYKGEEKNLLSPFRPTILGTND